MPFYRIIDQITPVTFVIKNQLDGKTTTSHAEHLRLAKLDWEIPEDKRPLRKAAYVVPPDSETDSDKESDHEPALPKIVKRYRRAREDSSSEDNIPLDELSRRLKQRKLIQKSSSNNRSDNSSENLSESDDVHSNNVDMSYADTYVNEAFSDDNMSVNQITKTNYRDRKCRNVMGTRASGNNFFPQNAHRDNKVKQNNKSLKKLLTGLADCL